VHLVECPEKKWDIFKVIKVDSWERWREIAKDPKMDKLHAEHKELADRDSIVRFYGEKIE